MPAGRWALVDEQTVGLVVLAVVPLELDEMVHLAVAAAAELVVALKLEWDSVQVL